MLGGSSQPPSPAVSPSPDDLVIKRRPQKSWNESDLDVAYEKKPPSSGGYDRERWGGVCAGGGTRGAGESQGWGLKGFGALARGHFGVGGDLPVGTGVPKQLGGVLAGWGWGGSGESGGVGGVMGLLGWVWFGCWGVQGGRGWGPRWPGRVLGAALACLGVSLGWGPRPRCTPTGHQGVCVCPPPIPQAPARGSRDRGRPWGSRWRPGGSRAWTGRAR